MAPLAMIWVNGRPEGVLAWHGEHPPEKIPEELTKAPLKMNVEGDRKATVNLIPMGTVIVASDLDHSIGN